MALAITPSGEFGDLPSCARLRARDLGSIRSAEQANILGPVDVN